MCSRKKEKNNGGCGATKHGAWWAWLRQHVLFSSCDYIYFAKQKQGNTGYLLVVHNAGAL